jgi:hypothetical protein
MKRARFLVTSRVTRKGLVQDSKGAMLQQWRAYRRQPKEILDRLTRS